MDDVLPDPLQPLIAHLRAHALRTDGPYTLRSGETSDWYLDGRQTTYDGGGALLVGRAVLEALAPDVDAVGGMTMGADPIAVATAVEAARRSRPLRAFSVRKAEKGHGVGGRLVGPLRPGDRIAVVEDATTTGGALVEAIEVLEDAGYEVAQVVALVDRSGGRVTSLLAERGVPYRALVSVADLGVAS
jgi:orotate phosphoribosyltransferase